MIFPGSFHHIGMACRNIETEMADLDAMGYRAEGPPVADPIQRVRVQFFAGQGPRVELIEPTSPDSPVVGLLKRGTKLYHLAYVVNDFDAALVQMDAAGFRLVGPAAPAAAFDMRRIAFVMARSGMMVELIEQGP